VANLTETDRQNWEVSASRWPLRAGLRPSPDHLKALYQSRQQQGMNAPAQPSYGGER